MIKYDNNSILNEQSIKLFNEWIEKTYNITPSMILQSGITVEDLYYMVFSWRDTDSSSRSYINTIPTWFTKALNQYIKSSAKFKKETNSLANSDKVIDRQYIMNILEKSINRVDENESDLEIKFDLKSEFNITVPEGYDGNLSFVKLYIPPEVITALELRPFNVGSTTGSGNERDVAVAHPLLRATRTYFDVPLDEPSLSDIDMTGAYDGGWCTRLDYTGTMWGTNDSIVNEINNLTSQLYGNVRENPLLFYSRFVNKNNISIDVIKNKDNIKIVAQCGDFKHPFANATIDSGINGLILPKILVDCKFYKYGID